LECIDKVRRYTVDGREYFLSDEKTQDAVVRNLQIMAESTQRLSANTKGQHSEVDWRGIGRFRNLVVHDYQALDFARIWSVIESRLDPLEQVVRQALADLGSPPESAD
jgi:uncharacterized protein with HEPN domain